jgi:transposase
LFWIRPRSIRLSLWSFGLRISSDTPLYEDCLIRGDALQSDLRIWLSQTSGLGCSASGQRNGFLRWELAARFSVSEKTIRRWEARGLTGRIYVFGDGRKRKGFSASAVEKFEAENQTLLERSSRFTKVDEAEKQRIYEMVCELARTGRPKTRNTLLRQVSECTGRARETIRYVLEEMERRVGPCEAAPASRGRLGTKEAAQIYKLSRQGVRIRDLTVRFRKSRSSLHRIINHYRAKELMSRKIDFIDSLEFMADDARDPIPANTGSDAGSRVERGGGDADAQAGVGFVLPVQFSQVPVHSAAHPASAAAAGGRNAAAHRDAAGRSRPRQAVHRSMQYAAGGQHRRTAPGGGDDDE